MKIKLFDIIIKAKLHDTHKKDHLLLVRSMYSFIFHKKITLTNEWVEYKLECADHRIEIASTNADIIVEKEGYRGIIQCKHYKNPVPPEPIRALWGCKDDFGADEVILVASSGITQAGADFVSNKPNFVVLNLDDIIKMSQQVNQQSKNDYISSGSKYGRRLDI